jgi:hypothetical protein
MKKTLLMTGAMLLVASVALAGGLNLAVGSGCWAENPVAAGTWACAMNFGTPMTMTTSFQLDADMAEALGSETIIDGQSDSATLPDWWDPACQARIVTNISGYPQTTCFDIWGGTAFGGPVVNVTGANRIRILVGYAVPTTAPIYIPAGIEFDNCHVNLTSAKTVGTGNCPGCELGFVLVLNQITLRGVGGVYEDCVTVLNNNCVSWQGATTPCSATPARNTTWGQVKSLYR